jgi:hypothetical protein
MELAVCRLLCIAIHLLRRLPVASAVRAGARAAARGVAAGVGVPATNRGGAARGLGVRASAGGAAVCEFAIGNRRMMF